MNWEGRNAVGALPDHGASASGPESIGPQAAAHRQNPAAHRQSPYMGGVRPPGQADVGLRVERGSNS